MFSYNRSSYESRIIEVLQNRFIKIAKRNKVLAKWAAGRLGYTDKKKDAYVKEVIFSYLVIPSDRKLIEKVYSDFCKIGVVITKDDISKKLYAIEDRIKQRMNNIGN